MQKQTEAALNNYYYIDPATLEDYAIYMADYATGNSDEIAMFQVKESDQMTHCQEPDQRPHLRPEGPL